MKAITFAGFIMKIKNIVLLMCIITAQASTTHINADISLDNVGSSDFDIFDDNNEETNNYLDTNEFQILRSAVSPENIIDLLQEIGAFNLLQLDFYLRTYVLNTRDVLDLPAFVKNRCYEYQCWVVGAQLFYDQTSGVYFSPQHDEIEHYLAIGEENVLEALDLLINKVQQLFPTFQFPFIDLFDIFGNARVQERRMGAMFQVVRNFNDTRFTFMVPFYYRERNYFLTDADREAIEALVGSTTEEDQAKLQKDHLISDKIGLGDTRLMLDFPCIDKEWYCSRLGIFATIPTAVTFVNGILGSSYKSKCPPQQPIFSFTDIFNFGSNPSTQQQAVDTAVEFLLGALDRLSAILLDKPLGNNGHFGIAPYYISIVPLSFFIKRPWAEAFEIRSRMSLEYLFPKTERRYFILQGVAQQFAERNFSDPAQATANLAFLETTFVNQFYPYAIEATVQPGLIFWMNSRACYDGPCFSFQVGTDTYLQTSEHLRSLQVSNALRPFLNTCKEQGFWAYQSTVYANLAWTIHRPDDNIIVGLHLADVVWNYGIGSEFTVALTIEKNF